MIMNRSLHCRLLRQTILDYVARKPNQNFYRFSRQLFNLPKLPNPFSPSKKLEWKETKIVGYTLKQMYEIVYEIEKYSEFVPWCKQCVITQRTPSYFIADMTVGFGPVTESFESCITIRPDLIKAESTAGKLLNQMVTTWQFQPGLSHNSKSCTMEFFVSFEFKSKLHSSLAESYFDEVANSISSAFLKRAEVIHGKPSMECRFVK